MMFLINAPNNLTTCTTCNMYLQVTKLAKPSNYLHGGSDPIKIASNCEVQQVIVTLSVYGFMNH